MVFAEFRTYSQNEKENENQNQPAGNQPAGSGLGLLVAGALLFAALRGQRRVEGLGGLEELKTGIQKIDGLAGKVRECVEWFVGPSGKKRCKRWTRNYKCFRVQNHQPIIPAVAPTVPPARVEKEKIVQGRKHKYAHPAPPTGEKGEYDAVYQVVDVDDLVTSHDPMRNFAWEEVYPRDIQDRDYSNPDLPYQYAVIEKAQNLDPGRVISTAKTSIEGPPVVAPDNIVLSGNSRAMAIKLAAHKHPEKFAEYKRALVKDASVYGLDAVAVNRMDKPILIRRVDVPLSEYAKFASLANESAAMALDMIGLTQAVAKYISDEMVSTMNITEDETLRQFLHTSRGRRFVDAVGQAIPAAKRAAYLEKGELTPEGVALVEGVLYYKLIPDTDLLAQIPKRLQNTLEAAIPEFYRIRSGVESGKIRPEWDIVSELPKAVGFYVRNLREYPLSHYLKQTAFIEIEPFEEDSLWGQLLWLVEKLGDSPRKFRNAIRQYADEAESLIAQTMTPIEALKALHADIKPRMAGFAYPQPLDEGVNWWATVARMKEGT